MNKGLILNEHLRRLADETKLPIFVPAMIFTTFIKILTPLRDRGKKNYLVPIEH